MLNQRELIQTFPQHLAATSTINTSEANDSVFIVESLLSASIRDYLPAADETLVPMSKLKQEITLLLAQDKISCSHFTYIDTQFYLILSMLKGYHRLAMLILNEKRNIDTAIGEAIKTQENFQKILQIYANILEGIESNNYNAAASAINQLSKLLSALTFKV